jgi:CheY-like chemotaxis protein
MKTYQARTCEEILNLHGLHRADLIIAESDLPLMGGIELCSRIRGDKALMNVSIILISDGTEASNAACREASANAVIAKPLESVRLFSTVSELLVIPQRKDLRVPPPVAVQAREQEGIFSGLCRNISISGMLLETSYRLSAGQTFTVRFMLRHNELSLNCKVMRVTESAGKYLCGLKFMNPDTKSMIIIDQFVKTAITA